MAAPPNTCTMTEQRGVVRFLWAKDMAAKDIHKEMLPMYGEQQINIQTKKKIKNIHRIATNRTSQPLSHDHSAQVR